MLYKIESTHNPFVMHCRFYSIIWRENEKGKQLEKPRQAIAEFNNLISEPNCAHNGWCAIKILWQEIDGWMPF